MNDKSKIDLEENPYAVFEDRADPFVPTATLQIYTGIGEYLSKPKDTYINRASSATMCPKRRWYQKNGYEGTPLTPRKLLNFLMGDLAEKTILYFVKQFCVGAGRLYSEVDFGILAGSFTFGGKTIEIYEQERLETKVDDLIVTGHPDGYGKRNSDGKWECVECKSAANWGFNNFKEVGPEDYLKQAHVIMASDRCKERGITETRYFYLRKETGHLYDKLISFDEDIWKIVCEEFAVANGKEEPRTQYNLIDEMEGRKPNRKPTGRKIAVFPCTFCGYLERCQGKYDIEWSADQFGNNKPTYIFGGV